MSSGKLDQSLDQIMKDNPRPAGRRGRAGRLPARKAATKSKAATTAVIAPAGGIKKPSKPSRAAPTPAVAAAALAGSGESKISVSNLPDDVDEKMIKDYFGSLVAPVKRVIVNYGPNGRSRGSATVFFNKPTAAATAAAKLDGTPVDGRAMRIEVLMTAKSIPPAKAPKSLQERVSGPKNAAKENEKKKAKAAAPKPVTTTTDAAKGGRNNKKKSGRAGKPKAKTAEELDAEMQDYFGGDAAAPNGTVQPAAAPNGDTGMVDEVM